MMHFNPPARIDDFARSSRQEELAEGWHTIIDSWLTSAVERTDGLFYNANSADAPAGGDPAPIFWDAFPLVIRNWFGGQPDGDELKYQAADTLKPFHRGGRKLRAVRDGQLAEELDLSHRQQDEYCEWHVTRDEDGSITSIQFTSEGPEYWEFLMSGTRPFFPPGDPRGDITPGDPDLALALYREHVSPDVQPEDLVWQHDVAVFQGTNWAFYAFTGDYNPLNKWNTTHGAMHLAHPSDTLRAEVSLAADATVLRTAGNDAEALACCAGFDDVNRSSDPLIGSGVNQAAATNHWVTLADPIGLYIAEMNTGALSHPDAWSVVRGSASEQSILRARLDVPDGADLTVGGAPLRFGGQAAEHIGIVLTGHIVARTGALPAARGCETSCCAHPERPAFKSLVGVGGNCAGVPWDALAPHLPSAPDTAGLTADPQEDGHRTNWTVGGDQATTPHLLVVLGSEDGDELDRRVTDLAQDPDGLLGYQQRGELLLGDKEHFGFQDGVSQVGVRGRLSAGPRHFLTRRWIDPADERARSWARPGQPLV